MLTHGLNGRCQHDAYFAIKCAFWILPEHDNEDCRTDFGLNPRLGDIKSKNWCIFKIYEKTRDFTLPRKVHSVTQRSNSHEPNGFKMLRGMLDAALRSLVNPEVAGMSWSKRKVRNTWVKCHRVDIWP